MTRSTSAIRPGLALAFLLTAVPAFPPLASAAVAPDSVRIPRLAAVGRLWSAVELFHPWTPRRPAAWDSALVRALPVIREAGSSDAFADAVDSLLASLGDPATHVMRANPLAGPSARDPGPSRRWLEGDVLLVRMTNGADAWNFQAATSRLEIVANDIEKARSVVIDLRQLSGTSLFQFDWVWSQCSIDAALVRIRATEPATRSRAHVGWKSLRATGASYYSQWRIRDGRRYSDAGGSSRRMIVLVNEKSWLPGSILALQANGRATLVAEGGLDDGETAPRTWLPLDAMHTVQMRTADVLMPDGGPVRADTMLAAASADTSAALAVAIAIARRAASPPRAAARTESPLPSAMPRPEAYETMRQPELPWRLLAAYRIWSRVEYFEAYRHLLGERWDQAFERAIPEFESATDSTAYALAVAHFYCHVEDTHGSIASPALARWRGEASPPVRVRMIEDRPVVVSLLDSVAARRSGFEVGDVILQVDGENAAGRMALIGETIAAANLTQRKFQSTRYLLAGPDSSEAGIEVLDARGRVVERRSQRLTKWLRMQPSDPLGPIWKLLPANLGYVDLSRLDPSQVDTMFSVLKDTRGLIFDLRGYPKLTAWPIAPRLTRRERVVAAKFRTPIATKPHVQSVLSGDEVEEFDQLLNPTTAARYLRPTVMLVDERTISQAEHTGLFFEAANGTEFVGDTTAGANGDITNFRLPGDIALTFSGHDVRHADGRQLQQVGLPLAVVSRPTLAGVRAGRDEVLEAGIRRLEVRIAGPQGRAARK